MKDLFYFKQFFVNQAGCGMKVNTDGVLLGALVSADNPHSILDIGTGTGVIAMMLAQRFPNALVEGVEINHLTAQTAKCNFADSDFSNRLKCHHNSFQKLSQSSPDKKYDLIVSNPPFFINSFKNPDFQKQQARHAGKALFKDLLVFISSHLSENGSSYLILPVSAKKVIEENLPQPLQLQQIINIKSSEIKDSHRQIICLGFENVEKPESSFIIYQSEKVYSSEYKTALKDFLTIF